MKPQKSSVLWLRIFVLAIVFLAFGSMNSFGAVTGVKMVMSETDYTSFPVTFTPDNDGTNDFVNFVFTGSNHDYRLIVDTTGDETAQPVEDWSNQDGKDWTWMGHCNDAEEMYVWWEGRDNQWISIPNGTYQVWIYENQGEWDNPDWQMVDDSMSVTVSTKYITGNVDDGANPIEGVRVNAGGPDGWGEAVTDANGDYTISGLTAGDFFVNAEKDGYFFTCEGPNCQEVTLEADPGFATYDISMQEAVTVGINVSLPAAFDPFHDGDSLWLNADANNTQGCGWAHGTGEIADGDTISSITLNMESLAAEETWRARITGEYCYWDNGTEHRDSYAGNLEFELADVDANSDGTPDTSLSLTLEKALSVSGSVTLPSASDSAWLNINVRLQDINDPSKEAWGWGNVEQNQASGTFYVPAVTPGTYTCYIQADGYMMSSVENVVVTTQDVVLDAVTLDEGASISGTLHVVGGADGELNLWLDAWSPSDFNWHGKNITVADSTQDVDFTVTGLIDELGYELNCWQLGYESTIGDNHDMPWECRIEAGSTGVDIYLTPYSGSITGTVTWPDAVSSDNVTVAINTLWGSCGETIDPVSPSADGTYTVSGLSTGEYLVLVNEVQMVGGIPIPTGNTALVSEVVFVANGEVSALNIDLEEPYAISGTVVDNENILIGADVVAIAMPIELCMGPEISDGMIMAPVADNAFTLNVGSGTYVITLESEDVDFASEQIVKVVSDDTEATIHVEEGNTAHVNVNFPAALQAADEGVNWIGGIELYKGNTSIGEWRGVVVGTSAWDDSDIELTAGVTSGTIDFDNLLDGDYTARFFSENYVEGSVSFTVAGSDVSASMTMTTGATITGKVVDAVSGAVLSSNVVVFCEAIPHVEGGYKSTEWNPDGAFDNNGNFSLMNLPAGTYLLEVEFQSSSSSSQNYAATSQYGIVLSGTETINVGSIALHQGTTISGLVTDADGNPLPNIPVEAEPMDAKYGEIMLSAKTGPDGYYEITGVDPEIPHYEVCAGIRPDPWEMMSRHCGYGEKILLNITPGSEDIIFQLSETSASLNGTITAPQGVTLEPPFNDEDFVMPVAFVILQRHGFPSDDPMDGIEAMSNPQGKDGNGDPIASVSYEIDNLEPGTYRMMVLSNGLCTYMNDNLVIAQGENELDIDLVQGATVSGTVTKPDGTYPTTSDLEMPVAMSENQEMVFGSFTIDAATNEISAYEIEGIKPGTLYYIALVSPGADGPGQIYMQDDTITASASSDSITQNAVMQESAPTFMVKTAKSNDTVNVRIFCTAHLMDDTASDIVSLTNPQGTLSDLLLSPDKMSISFGYTPAAGETSLSFTLSAHYGEDNDLVQQGFTLDLSADSANQGLVNSIMGGTVTLDGGDATSISFSSGTIEDAGSDGTLVQITSAEVNAGAESESLAAEEASGIIVIAPEASQDLPSWATAASQQYDFDLDGDSITQGNSATVTLQFDEGSDTDSLNVLHYTGGEWVIEETNKSIDEENNTISVSVTSLSPFVVAEGTEQGETPASSGGGGGGCFIETAHTAGYLYFIVTLFIALIPACLPIRSK